MTKTEMHKAVDDFRPLDAIHAIIDALPEPPIKAKSSEQPGEPFAIVVGASLIRHRGGEFHVLHPSEAGLILAELNAGVAAEVRAGKIKALRELGSRWYSQEPFAERLSVRKIIDKMICELEAGY